METQNAKNSNSTKDFSNIETTNHKDVVVTDQDKTNGIIAYITIIGWVIAYIQNQEKKSEYVNFHIRQMLGLFALGIVISFIPFIGWIASLGIIVLWIMGLLGAINGERKEVPLIGAKIQELLASVGK